MALTSDQINVLRDSAYAIAQPITEFILKDVARRVAKAGKITDTAAYQIYRAQALGESRKAIEDMLRRQLGITHSEINRLFRDAAKKSYGFDTRGIPWAQPFEQNGSLQQIVSAAAALAKKDFTNLTQTLGLTAPDGKPYPLQKAYQKCMDGAFGQVFTGASDYNTAIRQATHALADKGVRFIDYESGVSTSLEAAVRRNIMGGLGLMDEQIVQADHDMLGCNGWEISAHANSAPDHEDIQGRQYSDADFAKLNASLARRIGTLNCGTRRFPSSWAYTARSTLRNSCGAFGMKTPAASPTRAGITLGMKRRRSSGRWRRPSAPRSGAAWCRMRPETKKNCC